MSVLTLPTRFDRVFLIAPRVHVDERGDFMEVWRRREYNALGLAHDFVQDNLARSHRGVLRGLHFQQPNPQGKLVSVPDGEIFDVVVDLRVESATFGQWQGYSLSEQNHRQLWIPPGFAHGYQVTSKKALVVHKCTAYYDPACELAIAWNDPDLAIAWPLPDAVISAKDRAARPLVEFPRDRLFHGLASSSSGLAAVEVQRLE